MKEDINSPPPVSEESWKEKMGNLINIWRKSNRPAIMAVHPSGNYALHLSKVRLGSVILDLGCGEERVRVLLPKDRTYIGVDPFPIGPDVIKCKAEELSIKADTIICFAMLDGCQDLVEVLKRMNECAIENIVILTGLRIAPDKFHTHWIEEGLIVSLLKDFGCHLREEVSDKIWLFDFWRKK